MLTSILKFLFPIFELILRKWARTEKQREAYITFLEIMSRKGIQAALNRLSAQEQIDAVKKMWEERKAKEAADKTIS